MGGWMEALADKGALRREAASGCLATTAVFQGKNRVYSPDLHTYFFPVLKANRR